MKKKIKDILLEDYPKMCSYDKGYVAGAENIIQLVINQLELLAIDCEQNGNENDAYSYRSFIPYVQALRNKEIELSD